MSAIFLIFPLCLVCAALCMVLHYEPSKDARLSVPLTSITATMAFRCGQDSQMSLPSSFGPLFCDCSMLFLGGLFNLYIAVVIADYC